MAERTGGVDRAEVVVNRDGRVLIPKQMRQELGFTPGERLILAVEDGRAVLESREQLMARIRREVAESWCGDPGASVVDELIADRRAEAAVEDSAR
ncbi:AbrB/MazE/SpoVT family DNA-binding domain-containing protein [Pseudonocardia hispaniensis]|uniref:AbrB/MazE/SpoVT family DNA-binding domain-containing protein n=1 Tax=Pseudonocardia hispaniensis TaxID=904933 RepID=A0ABW1IWJ1_9PSEU